MGMDIGLCDLRCDKVATCQAPKVLALYKFRKKPDMSQASQ
jgi:hypothetical protein